MENYPSNSQSSKKTPGKAKAEKKVEKVITGEAIVRKKPLGRKFTETFVGGDAKSVWSYVTFDVVVPAIKDMVADAASQGIEKMLFGDVRARSRAGSRPIGASSSYVSYNRFASPATRREDPRREISRRARATHDFDEIVLATKAEAEEVIDGLFTLISEYDVATVADLYEMVGMSGEFTDEKWGWTDLRGAGATRVKGGYLLDLPPAGPLD